MKYAHKKIITAIILLGFGVVFWGSLISVSFSQENTKTWDTYTPLAPLPGTTQGNCVTDKDGKVSGCTTDIQTYLPGVFNLAIGIAGVLAVLMIIIGGVQYITTDAIQGKHDGKERIQNALRGLVLVLVSWVLLYTINPKLTVFDLNIETTTFVGTEDSVDTNDNPYINEGGSTTDLEENNGSSSSINKFEQGGSNSSENDDIFMHSTE